jgi:hypothetical protein
MLGDLPHQWQRRHRRRQDEILPGLELEPHFDRDLGELVEFDGVDGGATLSHWKTFAKVVARLLPPPSAAFKLARCRSSLSTVSILVPAPNSQARRAANRSTASSSGHRPPIRVQSIDHLLWFSQEMVELVFGESTSDDAHRHPIGGREDIQGANARGQGVGARCGPKRTLRAPKG